MKIDEIREILKDFSVEGKASPDAVSIIEKLNLPQDYVSTISQVNGGEGFVGDFYLILWKIEELEQFNEEYEVQKYAPDIFLFGSNGSGEAFGFDKRDHKFSIVQIPFIGMSLDYASSVANDFSELLKKMIAGDESLF